MHVVQHVPLLLHPHQEVDYHSLPLSFHSFLSEDLRDAFKKLLIWKHLLLSVKRNTESASEVRQKWKGNESELISFSALSGTLENSMVLRRLVNVMRIDSVMSSGVIFLSSITRINNISLRIIYRFIIFLSSCLPSRSFLQSSFQYGDQSIRHQGTRQQWMNELMNLLSVIFCSLLAGLEYVSRLPFLQSLEHLDFSLQLLFLLPFSLNIKSLYGMHSY